jgi:hypothetical protein
MAQRSRLSTHQRWLKTPGLKGQQHQDAPMRKFGGNEKKHLSKWELLDLT